jgi:hypothetical protein
MKITWPSWWAILFLALSCTAAAFVTFRVAAQNAPAAAAAAPDTPAAQTPARPAPSKRAAGRRPWA